MTPRIVVDDLTVSAGRSGPAILSGVSLSAHAGELLGVVGESGSGKTTLGLALLGFGRSGATTTQGDIRIDGRSIVTASPAEVARVRGVTVAYVPQDPATALNPARRIGAQLREVLDLHRGELDRSVNDTTRILSTLREMGLPADEPFLRRYPHELSGGQQQRVLLALAFLCEPAVIVLDEPTTALDVTTQAKVLNTIDTACRRHDTAAILISHDLDVVSSIADRVLVLYAGRVAEAGPTAEMLGAAKHPYTGALLRAAPQLDARQALEGIPGRAPRLDERGAGCLFAPRCPNVDDKCATAPTATSVGAGHVYFCHHPVDTPVAPLDGRPRSHGSRRGDGALTAVAVRARHGKHEVVHGVDVTVRRGESVALIGESGSGKTTFSQCIAGLHRLSAGAVSVDGQLLAEEARERSVADRRALQYIFQNPFASLNPRKRVRELLAQPARVLGLDPIKPEYWLERVALNPRVLDQRAGALSGGERQRVAIARGLTARPEFLICDEITSALDVSTQATVIELLQELQSEYDLGILFVTHNLPLVAAIADSVVVMCDGSVVESGELESVITQPASAYTSDLLRAVPTRAHI